MKIEATKADGQPPSIGRYKILSELGRGSMAKVYLAQDPVVDRKVALKVISPAGPVDAVTWQSLRTRFLLEARAAGKLKHPSAVAIYDADTDPETGLSYIAMEWIDGRSLDKILSEGRPLGVEQAIKIVGQVAMALDAAHEQGLIHRDIKPANILIGTDGDAKLSDFGIVKFEDLKLTSTGSVLGTPLYMSPEQIRGESLDGRSDLFSLGVVLYQCLTGTPPFSGDSVAGLTHQIQHSQPRAPFWSDPAIGSDLSEAVLRALEKDPAARYQTGIDLSEHLETALDDSTDRRSPQSSTEATATLQLCTTELHEALGGEPKDQRVLPAWVAAAVLLALMILLALLYRSASDQSMVPQTRPPASTTQSSQRQQDTRPIDRLPSEPTPQEPRASTIDTKPSVTGTVSREDGRTPTPDPSDDKNWHEHTEEVIDDAGRIYKKSVKTTKRWWNRHTKKDKGKSNEKGQKKD